MGPAAGVAAQEHGFDELADGQLFVGVEALGSFEGQAELVAGPAAFVVVEDERIRADGYHRPDSPHPTQAWRPDHAQPCPDHAGRSACATAPAPPTATIDPDRTDRVDQHHTASLRHNPPSTPCWPGHARGDDTKPEPATAATDDANDTNDHERRLSY